MTDKKTNKFVREVQRRMEEVGLGESLLLADPDTLQVFAIISSRESHNENVRMYNQLEDQLEQALGTIDELRGQKGNGDDVTLWKDLACLTDDQLTEKLTDIIGDNSDIPTAFSDFPASEITITAQEYEELQSLRVKRTNNRKQLSMADAKLKEYKKRGNTLESSRDHWKAKYAELNDLSDSVSPDQKFEELKEKYGPWGDVYVKLPEGAEETFTENFPWDLLTPDWRVGLGKKEDDNGIIHWSQS